MRLQKAIFAIVLVFLLGGAMNEVIAEEDKLPSADAVLIALNSSLGDQNALVDAFARLYPESHVLDRGEDKILIDLWANGQPYASVFMFQTASPNGMTAIFSYWDPDILVTHFAANAEKWVKAEIGPLTTTLTSAPGLPETTASLGKLSVTLSRVASGEESQLDITFSLSD
ncbi:hypothetical protein MUY21_15970 [Aliiroseovarius sp. S2029]|uniref:hypothetical protein n=1 Tax=Aliiroseovarius sp. S2029 TaxID=2936988 RepID=UPI0020C07C2F|nr:hypothetical protein [Aliiroseovarius sp. S2029]MCK8485531.1 hypothetical protein [Aliiroseovarius sp. S2029]